MVTCDCCDKVVEDHIMTLIEGGKGFYCIPCGIRKIGLILQERMERLR